MKVGLFEGIEGFDGSKNAVFGLTSIWHAVIWIIWRKKSINDIFCKINMIVNHRVSKIICLSWKWVQSHFMRVSFSPRDWENDFVIFLGAYACVVWPTCLSGFFEFYLQSSRNLKFRRNIWFSISLLWDNFLSVFLIFVAIVCFVLGIYFLVLFVVICVWAYS